jgi:hypothetical protein
MVKGGTLKRIGSYLFSDKDALLQEEKRLPTPFVFFNKGTLCFTLESVIFERASNRLSFQKVETGILLGQKKAVFTLRKS